MVRKKHAEELYGKVINQAEKLINELKHLGII